MLKAYRFTLQNARERHRGRDRTGRPFGQQLKLTMGVHDEFLNDRSRQNSLASPIFLTAYPRACLA
jgi:hypothetical protein